MKFAPNLLNRRLLICEERLKTLNGHFFEWNRAVRAIHEQAGAHVDICCHRDAIPAVRDGLGAMPHFHDTLPETPMGRNSCARLAQQITHATRAYQQSKQALKQTGPVDTVLVSTTPDHQLLAWSWLYRRSVGRAFSRLVLFFIMGQARYANYDPNPIFLGRARFYRHVLRSFKRGVEDGSVVLCTDSDQTKKEYELLCDLPFVELPTPRVGTHIIEPRVGKPVTFASLGPPRSEKGAAELIDAINLVRQMRLGRPIRFLIQWPGDFTDANGRHITIPSDWDSDPRIEVVRRFYDSAEYDRVMQQCDCLLLPYRWSDYFNRISAVLVETATAGIPAIVVENTWLHRAITQYGAGVTCLDRNPQSLAQAITRVCDNIESLSHSARARSADAVAHHSPERFLHLLWGDVKC